MTDENWDTFHTELHDHHLKGQWESHLRDADSESPTLEPNLWKGDAIREYLASSREVFSLDDDRFTQGARRALVLDNPTDDVELGGPTWTLSVAVQMVMPHEVAKAHRHNFEAFRFVIEGNDSIFTNVDGEEIPAKDRDLLLTPRMSWHDHYNPVDDEVIWIDGLNSRFVSDRLQVSEFEAYKKERQDATKPRGFFNTRYGAVRPANQRQNPITPPYRFSWEEAYEALQLSKEVEDTDLRDPLTPRDPHDGVVVEYVNPKTGSPPVLQTIALQLRLLEPGTETAAHRHTHSEVYYVVEGSGTTYVDGDAFEWSQGDFLVVPPMAAHSHETVSSDDAILFVMSDRPIYEAFNIHEELAIEDGSGTVS